MGGGEPGLADRSQPLLPPAFQPGFETGGEAAHQDVGRHPRAEAGGGAVQILGMMGEIDAEADHHRIALPLEQDARQLGAVDDDVVRPFDPRARREARDGLVQRHSGDQRKAWRRRVLGIDPDEGGGIEIAGRRLPAPALPPLPARLALGAKPQALGRPVAREHGEIVIGRACFVNSPDCSHGRDLYGEIP